MLMEQLARSHNFYNRQQKLFIALNEDTKIATQVTTSEE